MEGNCETVEVDQRSKAEFVDSKTASRILPANQELPSHDCIPDLHEPLGRTSVGLHQGKIYDSTRRPRPCGALRQRRQIARLLPSKLSSKRSCTCRLDRPLQTRKKIGFRTNPNIRHRFRHRKDLGCTRGYHYSPLELPLRP